VGTVVSMGAPVAEPTAASHAEGTARPACEKNEAGASRLTPSAVCQRFQVTMCSLEILTFAVAAVSLRQPLDFPRLFHPPLSH
jgi:hypothetical protein